MTQQPEASRIVEDTAIRILDELAVEGGRATRVHLFDKCQVKLWGHVANVAARRAGYTGHDEAEVERHGKEQLFLEAVNLLLEREQIVVWDDEGNLFALHPTHRDEYIPGTNLWRSQRQMQLTELRTQLLQFRDRHVAGDQSFDATLQKVTVLYAQQLRRGQLAGTSREEALIELLALADILFDPARMAELLGIAESEIRAVAGRRLQPTPPATPPKRKQPKQRIAALESPDFTSQPNGFTSQPSDFTPESRDFISQPADVASEPADFTPESIETGADIRKARKARGWLQSDLGDRLGMGHPSSIGKWETGHDPIPSNRLTEIREVFAKHPVNGQSNA